MTREIERAGATDDVRAGASDGVRAEGGAGSCRACGNAAGNRVHVAREMLQGTRDEFAYVECAACGTLRLRDVPDLAPYYSGGYYSFDAGDETGHGEATGEGLRVRIARSLGAYARRASAAYLCARREPAGALRHPSGWLATRARAKTARDFPAYLKETRLRLKVGQGSAVLDVGSGAGSLLLLLRRYGFRDLTGVDPFVEADVSYGAGVRVLKGEARDLGGQFDLVLANHSVEHTPDPAAALGQVLRLLRADRFAVVRVPVVARAWELYGVNWVQLDAPRHLSLYRPAAFRALAEGVGFAVEEVRFDSTAFQFWGSEQYARDVPLNSPRSYLVNPAASLFTRAQIDAWEAEAARLNERGEGDQAIFYLRKPTRRERATP